MLSSRHCGLFFSLDQIEAARAGRERAPFDAAWAMLREPEGLSPDGVAQLAAYRYRFDGDLSAGEHTIAYLQLSRSGGDDSQDIVTRVGDLILQAQCFELARDHPALEMENWRTRFAGRVEALRAESISSLHERLWLGLLDVAAGAVLEDDVLFETGVDIFRGAVRAAIHPEGYIEEVVRPGDGLGLYRQLVSVQALVLMAEAATQAGVNLWAFDHRGVSVATAATYLSFYYFYPEKWRWDEAGDVELGRRWFNERAGFWEVLHYRTKSKHLRPLLDELRPIHDVYGGGLTTLTHGVALKRGLFR